MIAPGPFGPFIIDALPGEVGKLAGDLPAHLHRIRRHLKTQPGGELHPTQHPQGVFLKGGRGSAKQLAADIALSVIRIDDPAFKIHRDAVDGEIAPGGGFPVGHIRVRLDGKRPVPGPLFAFPPGDADVDMGADLQNAEGFSHQVDPEIPQRVDNLPVAQPVYLQVDILAVDPHQAVAHISAHHQAVARPGLKEFFGDLSGLFKHHWAILLNCCL